MLPGMIDTKVCFSPQAAKSQMIPPKCSLVSDSIQTLISFYFILSPSLLQSVLGHSAIVLVVSINTSLSGGKFNKIPPGARTI
jgi:hypothetical protein